MKKSLGLVGSAAVATVLVAASPASAAAATVTSPSGQLGTTSVAEKSNVADARVSFRLSNLRCSPTSIRFNARTAESGFSGVQRFRHQAQLQRYTGSGWANATGVATSYSNRFPNDGRNFYYARTWVANHVNNGGSWRVAWQGSYLNGFGSVIAQTRVIYANCL